MQIYWSGTGALVAITSEDSFYVLRFDREAYNAALASGMEFGDEGVEAAFEVVAEVSERYLPISIHCNDPLIFFLQRQDCQMGRRLLHLYQFCQPIELPRRRPNKHHYPFRYVSLTLHVYQAVLIPHSPMYLLGYIPAHNKIYLVDKDVNVYAYGLSLAVVEYQTAVLRGDMEAASELLGDIPAEHKNKVARFLEAQGRLVPTITTEPF